MKLRLPFLPCLLPACLLLLGSLARADVIAPLVDSLSSDAAAWKSPQLSADWKDLGAGKGAPRKELAAKETVLGLPVQRSIATTGAAGALSRLDLLFLEKGPVQQPTDAAWQQTLRQTASQVSAALQAKLGKPGQLVKAAAGAATSTVIQEWTTPAASLRLTLEPGNRVWVSLSPSSESTTPAAAAASAAGPVTKESIKAHVQQRDNGDVIITGLPAVAETTGAGDLMLRIAQQLDSYYGWKVDCEAIARSIGWSSENTTFDEAKLFAAVAKEAKVRFKEMEVEDYKLDLLEIQHWIDRGQPVVFTRVWTELRHNYHVEFAQKLAADPTAELPRAKDDAEKAKWPSYKDPDYYSSEGVIVGYNKKRGELIFSHPGWGVEDENMRMREEEAAVSTLAVYYLPPD